GPYRECVLLPARPPIDQRLQSKVAAAEVVQETFLEAHRDFGQFQGTTEGQFLAWLRQVVATNLANLLRRYLGTQGRDVRLERQLALDLDQSSSNLNLVPAAPQNTPSQQAARREQAVLLANALGRLPPDYREVMVLRNLQGLSFPEVAGRMGRTVDSVEKLWARGLAQLRRALGGAA